MTVTETLVAGRYRIGPSLGAGGMGRVWLARDEVLRRDVAIKEIVLPFGLTGDEREELRERTLREARAAARLNHPNVVRIYDVQHGDERPWIVMEYVPARSLLQVIKENGPLPIDQVAGIGLAVLSALDAAFRVGVVHRDVKPSNVLIAHDGRVLLTDFGSAMIDEGEGALTQTGIILGSPRYIAPERAHNGVATLESDLWSLGATLYEAVEGRAPYTRETTLATLVALATEKPDPVERAGALKPVLTGLLQKNPKNRMRLHEVEERLRRIAHVQNAVRLHQVPPQRSTPKRSTYASTTDDNVPARAAGPVEATPSVADAPRLDSADSAVPLTPITMSGSPRRRRWALVAGGAATAAAVVAGTVTYSLSGATPPWAEADQTRTVGALPNDSPAVSAPAATPVITAATLPAGFTWYDSKSGFHVAWPATWTKVQESKTSVTLCAPGGPPSVSVREWARSDPDLSAALEREETAARLRNYKRLRMEVTPQQDSGEWEYTFTDPKMGALHAIDRAVVRLGRAYLIQYRTPAAKWLQNLARFQVIADTFRGALGPVGAQNAIPAGFVRYRSASGFQVAAPAKWTKIEETRTSVLYCAPGGPPLLGVRAWAPANTDLAAALVREEEVAKLPGYRRINMAVLPDRRGAVWEYTFTDPKMGRLHGLERAFLTSNNRAYLVQWRTPLDKWNDNLGKLGVVTSSFHVTAIPGRTVG